MRYRLHPGRRLLHGPNWAEAAQRVVFDACSGDYWVLTEAADKLLRSAIDGSPDGTADDRALLEELVQAGLLSADEATIAPSPDPSRP